MRRKNKHIVIKQINRKGTEKYKPYKQNHVLSVTVKTTGQSGESVSVTRPS